MAKDSGFWSRVGVDVDKEMGPIIVPQKETDRSVMADVENNEHAKTFVELCLGEIDAKIFHRLFLFQVDSEKSKSYEYVFVSYIYSYVFSCKWFHIAIHIFSCVFSCK